MNNESLVNSLYKFIKGEATMDKMNEANLVAYPVVGKQDLSEGKLPSDNGKDNSIIDNPMDQVEMLSEKEKAAKKVTQKSAKKEADTAVNGDIETANAGETEEPELTDLQKEAAKDKAIDQLTQDKDGQDPLVGDAKVKEEKKITPEVTGVTKESKLPDDPSQIKDPTGDIEKLAEEKCLTTVSDEKVAKDISAKYPGSRIVMDQQGKQYMVMVKEEKTCTCECIDCLEAKKKSKVPSVKADTKTDKLTKESIIDEDTDEAKKVKSKVPGVSAKKVDKLTKESVDEDVTVTVDDGNKSTTITSTEGGGTTITTTDKPAVETEVAVVEEPVVEEPVVEEDPDTFPGETEWTDDEAKEMGEKIEVADYLATLGKITEKQKKFIDDIKNKKIGKKNKLKLPIKK